MNASYIIKFNHPYKIRWDLFVILLSLYNTFLVPIEVSFNPDFTNINYFFWADRIIDMFFALDIIINFRYAYIHKRTGDEIWDWRLIAFNYLKGRLIIDVLAAAPFDLLGEVFNLNHSALKFFGLLKLIRILRVSRIITYLNFKDDVEITLRYVKIIFFLIIYIHCYSCFWFYIVNIDQTWLPPADFNRGYTTLYFDAWYNQYFDCLY